VKFSSAVKSIVELFQKHDIPLITAHEVRQRLGTDNFFVFDSSLLSQWHRGHIPGAIYVGMDDYDPGLLPANKSATLVFYCYHSLCTASHLSAKRARTLGYSKLYVMKEGTRGWVEKNYALTVEGEQPATEPRPVDSVIRQTAINGPTTNKAASRELLRQRLLQQKPRFYCPLTHLALPFVVGAALIAAAVIMLRNPSRWDLLSIPISFVLLNAIEWLIHRNLLHHRTWRFYDRHTPEHHVLYVRDDMSIRSVYEFRHVLVPIYAVFTLFLTMAPPAALLILLGLRNIGLLFFACGVAYVLIYEWMHLLYHLPPNKFLNHLRPFRFLQQHHAIHHLPQLMQQWNFNTTLPLWDVVSGTLYSWRPKTVTAPVLSHRTARSGPSASVISEVPNSDNKKTRTVTGEP